MNARELHAFLEVSNHFKDWITDRIQQYGFRENVDFVSLAENSAKPQGGRPTKEYRITLDMAKELCMVERNEKGKQARLYFIECERQLKAVPSLTFDPTNLLSMQQCLVKVIGQTLTLNAENAILKPKAAYADLLADGKGNWTLMQFAKTVASVLAMKPKAVLLRLRALRVLYHLNGVLTPYQPFLDNKWFELKDVLCNNGWTTSQTFITPLGRQGIAHMLGVTQPALPGFGA